MTVAACPISPASARTLCTACILVWLFAWAATAPAENPIPMVDVTRPWGAP